jgi:S1-C subfamily serine protease
VKEESTMTRLTGLLSAAALVAIGVLGDRVVGPALSNPSATAATTTRPAAVTAATTTTRPAAVVAAQGAAATAAGTALDAATENAFAVASPSVVYIKSVGVGSGSGVIYDPSGDIVTNAHVVANAQTLRVTLSNGKTYTARIVGTDTADDLAVIRINASGLPAARFAASGTYHVAQMVLAIGSPLGLQQTVTSGLISALNRTVQEPSGAYLPNALQTSAPINPGNSGGALVTLDGTVVGIPTLASSDPQSGSTAQGIGFAVPSSRVTYIAHQIIATGRVEHTGRAFLGVGAVDATSAQASPFDFGNGGPTVEGALVRNVAPGSPADQAGVQQGDVITAANGGTITGEDDLLVALAHSKPGQTMTLALNRNGSPLTVHVHLGELQAS